MRRTLTSLIAGLLAGTALAGVTSAAQSPRSHPPAVAPSSTTAGVKATTVTVPPINYRERTLANGLHVFSVVDKTTPNVTVQLFYDVGGKDDPSGRSGFAHLFEHLMFKATRDMPAEYMDRLTEDVGGLNNASTAEDATNFYEVIPGNHLERLLWAEAQRMSSLQVDQANFASERQVVEEELRQRVLADPYGRLFSYLTPENSYKVHPYRRPVIGSIEDLDNATLADVQAFHATYYRPDNANLIVIGNFDPDKLDAWIDQYFGAIGHPAAPIPRVTVVEPQRTGPRVVTGYGPEVPLPAVELTFLGPTAASHDAAPLAVVDAILTTGHASRLYRDLIYQQQLAQDAFSDPGLHQQSSLFSVGLIMASGKTVDQGETALRQELKRLADAPVTPDELARAKNQLIAQTLRQRETVDGRANELGLTVVLEGDPAKVNTDVAEVQVVTAADIQRVVRRYLADDKRLTIRYLAEADRPKGAPAPSDSPSRPSPPAAAPAPDVAKSVPPPESLPHKPPAPGADVVANLPHPSERVLPNGLKVIVAKTSDLPLVTAALTIKAGASSDPAGLAGLQNLTNGLLTTGTTTQTAPQISEAVERLGGTLEATSGSDGSYLTLTVLADQLNRGLPILSDVARHPAFAPAELERLRHQKLDSLQVSLGEPGGLAGQAVWPAVFGGTAYGHPTGGTTKSLSRITRDEVTAQYAREMRPDNAVLVLTGDIEPEQGFALAERVFGDWAAPSTPLPKREPTRVQTPPRVIVIDLPGLGQAAVALAGPTIGRADPRYFEVEVANAVLGGGYSARLNEEVRVKRGLSYGSSSAVNERRDTGLFIASAQTRNEAAPEVAKLLLEQARGLSTLPLGQAETDAREAALVGGYGRTVATTAGLAGELASNAVYNIDPNEIARYTRALQQVTPDQARAAAPLVVDPDKATLLIVGDSKLFMDKLKAAFPNAELIPADKLDLESPSLK